MNATIARFSPAALLLSMILTGACGHGGGGGSPPAAPEPPLDPQIADLVGTWVVETDNFEVLEGVAAPIGLDNAVVEAVLIWSDPTGGAAAFELLSDTVQAPELGLGMAAFQVGSEIRFDCFGIYYLPQYDVTVQFTSTDPILDATRIDTVAEAEAYAGMRIVERQDPISQEYFWDIADGSTLVSRMQFDLTLRR